VVRKKRRERDHLCERDDMTWPLSPQEPKGFKKS